MRANLDLAAVLEAEINELVGRLRTADLPVGSEERAHRAWAPGLAQIALELVARYTERHDATAQGEALTVLSRTRFALTEIVRTGRAPWPYTANGDAALYERHPMPAAVAAAA